MDLSNEVLNIVFDQGGANIYGLGLSNELLFIIIAQGAAKL